MAKNAAHSAAAADATPLSENGTSLYVHVPFCVSKCSYCDFNSWELHDGGVLERTVDALLAETRIRAKGLRPQTVFLGGGTPSLLPPNLIGKLLDGLHDATDFRNSSLETTLEANPESFDFETARAAFGGGVTRASIGVQSLRPDVLRAYDRVHTASAARQAFFTARKAGFQRINVDLIYSFPGQNSEEWFEDLEEVMAWEPEHLSCYELSYEPGTPLTKAKDSGLIKAENRDVALQLFNETRARCESRGLSAYEVSNFAMPGEECLHNLAGWRSLDCVGVGAGAVTWQGGVRRKNLAKPEDWIRSVESGAEQAHVERPGATTRMFDCFLMGLRLCKEGVSISRVFQQTGLHPKEVWAKELESLFGESLLLEEGDFIRATPRGLRILDSVLGQLLPAGSGGEFTSEQV